MMVCLLGLMIVLAVRSLLSKGGEDGIKFYLFPVSKSLTEGSGGPSGRQSTQLWASLSSP